jgi:hypothetical protein
MFRSGLPRLLTALALLAVSAWHVPEALAQNSYAPLSLIGGSGRDFVHDMTRDAAGNIYLVGETDSSDFPVVGGVQSTLRGLRDAFVVKLDPTGKTIVFSTYLGGSFTESANGVAVDASGIVYVTGQTSSADFPRVQALDNARSGSSDAFITKLNAAGSAILFSTFLGGDSFDDAFGIGLDPAGNVYVAGRTQGGLPVVNAVQPTYGGNEDGFVAKLNALLTGYDYVTYVGGGQRDNILALDVDSSGRACVAGDTESTDLPVVNAPQAAPGSGGDAFFAVLGPTGRTFDVASYLGGSRSDAAASVACSSTTLAVGGHTSSLDFPTGPAGHPQVQATPGDTRPDGQRAVMALFERNAYEQRVSTYLDGFRRELPALVKLTEDDDVVSVTSTDSADLPVTGTQTRLGRSGVYTSPDNGATWQPGGLEGTRVNQVASLSEFFTDRTFVAATDLGIRIRRREGANEFHEDAFSSSLARRVTHAILVDRLNPCTWTVGVESTPADGATPVGAARTLDCGTTWNPFGGPIFRVKSLSYLGSGTGIVATLDGPRGSDTCVLTASSGTSLGCLNRPGSDQIVAVDPSNPCRWYEANIGGGPNVVRGFSLSTTCDGAFRTAGLPFAGFTHLISSLLVVPATAANPDPTVVAASGKDVWALRDGPGGAWVKKLTLSADIGGLGFDASGNLGFTFGTRYQRCAQDFSSCDGPFEVGSAIRSVAFRGIGTPLLYASEAPNGDLYVRQVPVSGAAPSSSYQGVSSRGEEVQDFEVDLVGTIFALQSLGETTTLPGETRLGPGGQEDVSVAKLAAPAPPCVTLSLDRIDLGPREDGTVFLTYFVRSGCGDVVNLVAPPWLTVLSQGDAFAILRVQPNPGATRTGIVQVGDAQLTVTQRGTPAPGTAFGVQTTATFDAEGGFETLKMEGNPDDHTYAVIEGAEWLIGAGRAGGNYLLVAEVNTGPARTATVEIRNPTTDALLQTLTYAQEAAEQDCGEIVVSSEFVLDNGLPFVSLEDEGGEASVDVRADSGCSHESSESLSWVGALVKALVGPAEASRPGRVAATLTASGNARIAFQVAPNLGLGRVGTITIGGHPVLVVQGAHPDAVVSRANLSEGASSEFFDTQIALANPSRDTAVVATATFDTAQGATFEQSRLMPPSSRATIDPKAIPGLETAEFSTSIAADGPIVTARVMSWDATGYGSHGESGIPAPATTWYLAEGATHSGFDLFYLLHNPGLSATTVTVRYLRPAPLVPIEKPYVVPAATRLNVWVNLEDPGLAATDVSAVLTSTSPIVVERAMYLSNQGRLFNAGHESAGVTAPATEWFFAEGATGTYFDEFVLIANPGDTPAQVTAGYLLENGSTIDKAYSVAANSRFNVWVDLEDPLLANAAVSTRLISTNGVPIIAERAMWWPGASTTWHEAHNSAGATQTGTRWAMAAGEQGGPASYETYVLVANTSAGAGQARITLFFEDGTPPAETTVVLPATSRTNVPIGSAFPAAAGRRFAVLVESLGDTPAQLVVEQAIYSNASGVIWAAGANMLATPVR